MAANLSPIGNGVTFFNAQGVINAGGKINTYTAGTTQAAATYTDSTQAVQNANPIILGSNGMPANEIWLAAGVKYKFVITDSNNNILATLDNIIGINDPSLSSLEWVSTGITPTFISGTSFSLPGDQTGTYTAGRRVKAFVTAGAVYGAITSSSFSSGMTTVVIAVDSVPLDTGLSSVNVSFLSSVNQSIPSNLYKINQAQTGHFWADSGGIIDRLADRLFIGDAVVLDGNQSPTVATWVKSVSSGVYEYLEADGTIVSPAYKAGIGVFGAARSSTGSGATGQASIGIAALAYNDYVGGGAGVWGLYSTVIRKVGCTGPTQGIEVDVANTDSTVAFYPAAMFAAGGTMAAWLCSGGESTATPGLVGVASCAIGIISNDTAKVARFDKGIVFENKSIEGCDGATGNGIALALASGHQHMWFNNSNQIVAELVCNAKTVGNALRLDFNDAGLLVQDRASGVTMFQVQDAPTAVNYITVVANGTGTPPKIVANGSDTNIDLLLSPKGTGILKLSYGTGAASNAAAFVASRTLAIRDGNGIIYYIPADTATW